MVEVALSLVINIAFLFGSLETGWYLDYRQGLVRATREAARAGNQKVAQEVVQNCLVGMDFPDAFINNITVSWSKVVVPNSTGTKMRQVIVSVPTSSLMVFGGTWSKLLDAFNFTSLQVEAYDRVSSTPP